MMLTGGASWRKIAANRKAWNYGTGAGGGQTTGGKMSQEFTRLLEPGRIGPVTTRNHIIKTANGTSYMDEDQTVGERMIAYYENLAKGGVGYLTVESCGVEYPLGIQHVHYAADGTLIAGVQLHLDDDKYT